MSMNSEPLDGQYIPEHVENNDLDQILRDWSFLSAHAYQGFLEEGPGTLVIAVSEDEKAELAFLAQLRPFWDVNLDKSTACGIFQSLHFSSE